MDINCQPLLRYDLFTSTRILIYPEYPIMHCGIDFSKMASLSVKRSIVDQTNSYSSKATAFLSEYLKPLQDQEYYVV